MPDEIEGQIVKRKDYVDFMDFSPACLSLKAVVSAKVKNVLEQIHVRKSEYILKRIKIDGIASDFIFCLCRLLKIQNLFILSASLLIYTMKNVKYFKTERSFTTTMIFTSQSESH